MKYVTTIGQCEYIIEIVDETHVIVNDRVYEVDFDHVGTQPVYSLLVDGNSYEAYVFPDEENWQVVMRGRLYPANVEDEREKRLRAAAGSRVSDRGEYHLKAPMPGLIVDIPIKEGQNVQAGEVLLILESMKMQNELRSPREGKVTRLRVKPGDNVDQRQTLLSVV